METAEEKNSENGGQYELTLYSVYYDRCPADVFDYGDGGIGLLHVPLMASEEFDSTKYGGFYRCLPENARYNPWLNEHTAMLDVWKRGSCRTPFIGFTAYRRILNLCGLAAVRGLMYENTVLVADCIEPFSVLQQYVDTHGESGMEVMGSFLHDCTGDIEAHMGHGVAETFLNGDLNSVCNIFICHMNVFDGLMRFMNDVAYKWCLNDMERRGYPPTGSREYRIYAYMLERITAMYFFSLRFKGFCFRHLDFITLDTKPI